MLEAAITQGTRENRGLEIGHLRGVLGVRLRPRAEGIHKVWKPCAINIEGKGSEWGCYKATKPRSRSRGLLAVPKGK